MDFLIKKILKEISQERGLSDQEIILFKYLNKKFNKNQRKDKFFDDIRTGLKLFSMNPNDAQYYFDLFVQNYREDGNYEDLTKSQFKGPKDFKARKTTNVRADEFSRNKLPFKGSNLEGFWDRDINKEDYYVVKSYGWYPIYLFKKGIWYKIIDTYSSSTGKHISNTNPITYDNRIKHSVVMVTRPEMEKLMYNSNFDDIIKYKKEELLKNKSQYIGTQKKIRNDWWDETEGNTFTPIKIKFKIKDIKQENDNAVVEVEIMDVLKREGNKVVDTPENYLKGELPGITKEKVEKRIESNIKSDYRKYFGTNDIENPIKLRFIHSKK